MSTTDPTPYTPTAKEITEGMRPLPSGEFRELTEQEVGRGLARVRAEAVAPVLALHRAMPLYDLATECKTPDDEDHADAHHSESDDGELLCWDLPAGTVCEHCRDTDGSLVDHPCETFAAASIEQETQP